MQIKNISDHTIAINLFGRLLEIPIGYTIDSREFWGGEDTVKYLAIKFRNELKVTDENGNEITELECPICGTKVNIPCCVQTKELKIEIPSETEIIDVLEEKPTKKSKRVSKNK